MARSTNVINLEMCVKYYYRRRGRSASQSAGPGEAKRGLQSEKHISLSGVPPEESTNTAIKNRSTFVKHRRHWERGWYGELWLPRCYHQRAATCAAPQLKTVQARLEGFTGVWGISFEGSPTFGPICTQFYSFFAVLKRATQNKMFSLLSLSCVIIDLESTLLDDRLDRAINLKMSPETSTNMPVFQKY